MLLRVRSLYWQEQRELFDNLKCGLNCYFFILHRCWTCIFLQQAKSKYHVDDNSRQYSYILSSDMSLHDSISMSISVAVCWQELDPMRLILFLKRRKNYFLLNFQIDNDVNTNVVRSWHIAKRLILKKFVSFGKVSRLQKGNKVNIWPNPSYDTFNFHSGFKQINY